MESVSAKLLRVWKARLYIISFNTTEKLKKKKVNKKKSSDKQPCFMQHFQINLWT
jgi:hypothetical protein